MSCPAGMRLRVVNLWGVHCIAGPCNGRLGVLVLLVANMLLCESARAQLTAGPAQDDGAEGFILDLRNNPVRPLCMLCCCGSVSDQQHRHCPLSLTGLAKIL